MEDGFDSRRRYKTENQSFTHKSGCLILLFLALARPQIIRFYPFLSVFIRVFCCKFVANFCNAPCNTRAASLVN